MLRTMISRPRRCISASLLFLQHQQAIGDQVSKSLAHLTVPSLHCRPDPSCIFSQSLVRNSVIVTLALGLVAFLAIKQATKTRPAAKPTASPQVLGPTLLPDRLRKHARVRQPCRCPKGIIRIAKTTKLQWPEPDKLCLCKKPLASWTHPALQSKY